MKNTKFTRWVRAFGGVQVLARALNVDSSRVRAWVEGRATPRPDILLEILSLNRAWPMCMGLTTQDIVRTNNRWSKGRRT